LLPAQKAADREIDSQTLCGTLILGTTPSRQRNTQDLFLRRLLHKVSNIKFNFYLIMGKKSKGGKTEAKEVKQAMKGSSTTGNS
jgi:hypothetical protein